MSTPSDTLPTWDEMSDLDKGCALLHMYKREADGAAYAVKHYPARYLNDPLLKALSPVDASRHAAGLSDAADDLPDDEYVRLYELALDADAAPTLEGAAE